AAYRYRTTASTLTSVFFMYRYDDHRDLHSFPTRRSSDLGRRDQCPRHRCWISRQALQLALAVCAGIQEIIVAPADERNAVGTYRSEEHTSELQSQSNLVCRLLLEKKNTRPKNQEQAGIQS